MERFIDPRILGWSMGLFWRARADFSVCCVTQQNRPECRLRSKAPRRKIEQVDFCEQNVEFDLGESGVPWKLGAFHKANRIG
jgi:hypothetical protein